MRYQPERALTLEIPDGISNGVKSRNEVSAREGIDTKILKTHNVRLDTCRNEVSAREGIDTCIQLPRYSFACSVEMRYQPERALTHRSPSPTTQVFLGG